MNEESWGAYNGNNYNDNNNDNKFKTSMIRPNLCDYSDAYIHVKATITIPNTAAAAAPVNNTNKKNDI